MNLFDAFYDFYFILFLNVLLRAFGFDLNLGYAYFGVFVKKSVK